MPSGLAIVFLLLYYILIYSAVDERIKKHVIAPICVRNTEVIILTQSGDERREELPVWY